MDFPKKIIAFDIQGVLIGTNDPNDGLAMQYLLKRLKRSGHKIIVWTSDSQEYAKSKVKELNLEVYVDECRTKFDEGERPDIAFDDNPVTSILAEQSIILED